MVSSGLIGIIRVKVFVIIYIRNRDDDVMSTWLRSKSCDPTVQLQVSCVVWGGGPSSGEGEVQPWTVYQFIAESHIETEIPDGCLFRAVLLK